ncbi:MULTISPECIES: Nif3-like dinuclear metal center hexameric protein [unclassified Mycoplasma]|uniref:Nif3-like dinuclear metal center hexameric protein n=1 Tax=unclassified Mycoplasma TaxID=2683645 RepID=UPI00211C4C07|nr:MULTISPECIES: Nif3-like dinuclear metal center hexameric protein [unclassified Mycoplasma]UUM19531.1 Nif3-like dinuclear metal center hexameric protein [Mycoplasma sp. 1578d]UUM24451.1 Nif3-like dinuclear metal center hexameric protein [Mycoplasma sp. 3686d]
MQVKQLINYLNELYPNINKEPWDPSGFAVKFNQRNKINGVVLAIDLTYDVLQKAIDQNCNLIITHHPFFFEKTKQLEWIKAPYKQDIFNQLKKLKIFVYSLHTNYDGHLYGTSYQIVKYLGLENYFEYGSPKYSACLSVNLTFAQVLQKIYKHLNLEHFRTNFDHQNYHQPLRKIAILSGSGYIGDINQFHFRHYDLIISSDFKWSDWINFHQIKAKILEIPHLDEQVFIWHMSELLTKAFPELNVLTAEIRNPFYNITTK